jgi:cytoskeletal protein CcmA (bactofilin family)
MKLIKSDSGSSDFGWIGQGVVVSGQVTFNDRLQVDGKITGKLESQSGILIVGEVGMIEAQVDVGVCVVHGTVNGDLSAKTRIEIHRTGRVHGDIATPALLIEEGATLNGAVKMTQDESRRAAPDFLSEEAKERHRIKGAV